MREFDLTELNERAKADTEKKRLKMKTRYRYARDLGFSSSEAVILQGKSEYIIKRLADERKESAGEK